MRQFKALNKSAVVMESGEPEISDAAFVPREEIAKFLRHGSINESLIATPLLRKAMSFSVKDVDELGELWALKAKNREEVDSSVSPPSSSDEYLSPDGIYLKNHLSEPLSRALREIVAKKPFDPIEYLGHWLLHYKVCEERGKRRKELDMELAIERRRLESEEEEAVAKEKLISSVHEEEEEEQEEGEEEEGFENDEEFINPH